MKKIFSFVFLALSSFSSTAVNAETLSHVVSHTLATHPKILSQIANEESNAWGIKRARSGFFPEVNVRTATGFELSDNIYVRSTLIREDIGLKRRENEIAITQPLFDGFKVKNQMKEQKDNYRASVYRTIQTQQEYILRVAEAYLNVLRSREQVVLAQDSIGVNMRTLKQVQERFHAGAGTRGEVELARTRISLAQLRVDTAKGTERQANARYVALTGMAPPAHLDMPKSIRSYLPHSMEIALKVAERYHPALHSREADVESAKARVKVAKAELLPHVDLELNSTDHENLDGVEFRNRDASAMLVLRYNLFRGGQDVARINQARSEQVETHHNYQTLRRDVIENVISTWSELITNRELYNKQRSYVMHAKEVVEDYKEQFSIGKRALFNVLDAENELFRARTGLTDAYYDSLISSYRVMASIGMLTPAVLS